MGEPPASYYYAECDKREKELLEKKRVRVAKAILLVLEAPVTDENVDKIVRIMRKRRL